MNTLSRRVSLIYRLRRICERILPFPCSMGLRFHSTYRENTRDALVKTYFDHVYPFAPVIDRAGFVRGYESGSCSLFLLRVILTSASLYAPADVLSSCGFASRSAAQASFFSKASLLHDFAAEDDPLLMLQGSIVLCSSHSLSLYHFLLSAVLNFSSYASSSLSFKFETKHGANSL